MIQSFSLISACSLLCMAVVQAEPAPQASVPAWLDASLAGKTTTLPADAPALSAAEVEAVQAELWQAYSASAKRAGWDKHLLPVPKTLEQLAAKGEKLELKGGQLKADGHVMPYVFMAKGEKPATGWPMFICLHGGGQHKVDTAHGWSVNSREWQAQMRLTRGVYQPAGLYFIPRMADDRLGRWWHKHNIDIFTRVIRDAVLFNDVDPNKIYIMGISQGGYGTCHLAPFMADQFAAAGSMAGGMMTVTENLRNLPFRSDIGENDTMYKRIKLAKKLHATIDAHKAADPQGYVNQLAIQKGRGHGIDYQHSPAWLAQHRRQPYPEKIVWRCYEKAKVYRDSFYWLGLTQTPELGEFVITASADKTKNLITITAEEVIPPKEKGGEPTRKALQSSKIIVNLNDQLVDLDQVVTIMLNGKQVFKGKLPRSRNTMLKNLAQRGDPNYAFPAQVVVGP
ncbi:hypothetical protein JIN77_05750 [Verrucomicrobiaceae bacterium R5-34]|nr:hypothetical protein [Verrucomicrobiaceae bacterium R5-34]